MWVNLRHLFPAQVRGGKSSGWLRHTCSLRPGRDKAATTGMHSFTPLGSPFSACGSRGREEVATDWGTLTLVGVSPSARRGRGWRVGKESVMAAPPLVHHSTMVTHFQGRPHFLQEHSQPQSPSLPSRQAISMQLTAVLSPSPFS